jgi:hypothetical protein
MNDFKSYKPNDDNDAACGNGGFGGGSDGSGTTGYSQQGGNGNGGYTQQGGNSGGTTGYSQQSGNGNAGYTQRGSNSTTGYTQNGSNSGYAQQGGKQGDLKQTINMAAMLAQAFSGKSEEQIMHSILEQAEQGKRDGTLTNADLDNFFAAVAPFMDGFKRKKLSQIITSLKGI